MKTSWQQAALYRPVAHESVVPQIVDQLREHIVLRKFDDHDRLPPLHKLAELFGVSVPTVHAAIQALAYLGLVRIRHGVGTFVERGAGSHHAIIAGLRHARPEELFELRGLLEVHAASLMAQSMPKEDRYQPMIDLHFWMWERQDRRDPFPDAFVDTDIAFHNAVVVGSGSAYAASLHQQVCDRLRRPLLTDAGRQLSAEGLGDLHTNLVNLIALGNDVEAVEVARKIVELERPP